MLTRIVSIALAFVGLIVGAGFASGQEVMQYFVAFGMEGVWGAIASCIIMTVSGLVVLQLGSYFQAQEHTAVFKRVSKRWVAMFLDVAVMITLFSTGVVMMAGAGSNLNQQFDAPVWLGTTLMLVFILAAGMLNVDKVSTIIGAITPFIIVFLVIASIYAVSKAEMSFGDAATYAETHVQTTLPHWGVSALNYVGFNLMVAVSMAIIIGGDNFNPREAGIGGLLGGLLYGGLLLLSTVALMSSITTVENDELPMLSLVNSIHPVLGTAMAVVVYGMIFNTGIGMFYALAKRVTARKPQQFRPLFIAVTLIGFGLGFLGFKTLIAYVYPALGYVGVVLIIVMCIAWLRGRIRITEEAHRRRRMLDLVRMFGGRRDADPADSGRTRIELEQEMAASNLPNDELEKRLLDRRPDSR
ncbi:MULTISPECIES: YkvI family membrane protein [unclassified Corynebacterium]|uniref:YkvI family membrane protein n=1 Tax=unclassified Corynebacterium TaxID=2624378 RepID=UPI0030AEE615